MAIFPLWYNSKRRTKRRNRLEKEQRSMSSTLTVKALVLVQSVLSLHNFIRSSVPHNLGVPWKVTTLAMDNMFFFAEPLDWWTPQKRSLTEQPQLFLASIPMMKGLLGNFYTTVFLVPHLCNFDCQQLNRLLLFWYTCNDYPLSNHFLPNNLKKACTKLPNKFENIFGCKKQNGPITSTFVPIINLTHSS